LATYQRGEHTSPTNVPNIGMTVVFNMRKGIREKDKKKRLERRKGKGLERRKNPVLMPKREYQEYMCRVGNGISFRKNSTE
jgi:hypothetical protein